MTKADSMHNSPSLYASGERVERATTGRTTPIRHRLLLSLATAPRGVTVRELATEIGRGIRTTHGHLMHLRDLGLVEHVPIIDRGCRLRPGVVVGERGFVGRVQPLNLEPWGQDEEIAACG